MNKFRKLFRFRFGGLPVVEIVKAPGVFDVMAASWCSLVGRGCVRAALKFAAFDVHYSSNAASSDRWTFVALSAGVELALNFIPW